MTEPRHHVSHRAKAGAFGQGGAIDHDHLKAKAAGRDQFGLRARAARILGDDNLDGMIAQQGKVILHLERSTGVDDLCVRQGLGFGLLVNQTQQIVVLRPDHKAGQVLASDGQKDPGRVLRQGGCSGGQVGDHGPMVAGLRLPRGALKSREGQVKVVARGGGVVAHLGRKGMRGVDDMGDVLVAQISDQARYAAKAADAQGQGLGYRVGRTPGIGKDRVNPGFGKGTGQEARLGRAAEQKDALHG